MSYSCKHTITGHNVELNEPNDPALPVTGAPQGVRREAELYKTHKTNMVYHHGNKTGRPNYEGPIALFAVPLIDSPTSAHLLLLYIVN